MSNENPSNLDDKKMNDDNSSQESSNPLLAADSYASLAKGNKGVARIIKATGYSVDGFKSAFKKEAAFRQIILINIILVPTTFFLNVSAAEQAIMITVCLLSIIVELFNSAIEAVVDRISLDKHELSKDAKDMGSAAQFVSLAIIFVSWAIILFK